MTPETLAKANKITKELKRLEDTHDEWESVETVMDGMGQLSEFVPADAWATFRNACRANLQRQIDAKRAELAAL